MADQDDSALVGTATKTDRTTGRTTTTPLYARPISRKQFQDGGPRLAPGAGGDDSNFPDDGSTRH